MQVCALLLYFFEQFLHIIGQIERALVQVGVVIPGLDAAGVPRICVEVAHGMYAARREPEQPVAGRVGRDMRLEQARQLKLVHDVAVRALAGERVALVERAFVLVDQHAVLTQRLVAVAVELHREQALARAERVG